MSAATSVPIGTRVLDLLATASIRLPVGMLQCANLLLTAELARRTAAFALSSILPPKSWAQDILQAETDRREAESKGNRYDEQKLNSILAKASLGTRIYFTFPSGARDMFWGLSKISTIQLLKWIVPSVIVCNGIYAGVAYGFGQPSPLYNKVLSLLGPFQLDLNYTHPLFSEIQRRLGY